MNDPAFVAEHKARAEPLLAIAANSCVEPSTLRLIDMDGHIIKVIKNADPILRLVCSSPGNLMCVVGYSLGKATVLNLATGEAAVIHLKSSFMGFGRAAPSGAYKIVCVSPSSTEILTLGDGVGWRQTQPLPSIISYNSRPVVVRGVMYLLLAPQLNGDGVICFDLESEEWKGGIRGPPSSQPRQFDTGLQELNGALCMLQPEVGNIYHGTMSIWLLIDSGKGVWIKVYSIPVDPSAYSPIMPLRILVGDDGKLLFYVTLRFDEFAVLQIYDPRHRTFTDAPKVLAGDNGGSINLCSLHLDSFQPTNV